MSLMPALVDGFAGQGPRGAEAIARSRGLEHWGSGNEPVRHSGRDDARHSGFPTKWPSGWGLLRQNCPHGPRRSDQRRACCLLCAFSRPLLGGRSRYDYIVVFRRCSRCVDSASDHNSWSPPGSPGGSPPVASCRRQWFVRCSVYACPLVKLSITPVLREPQGLQVALRANRAPPFIPAVTSRSFSFVSLPAGTRSAA